MNTSDQRALAPVIFQFHSTDIRTFADDNGEPWFCAKDVCEILGYRNDSDAIKKHCREAGVAKRDLRSGGQNREITFINEGNLYRLIIKSRKPEAEEFEIKLMEEILPTIRKTGKYEVKRKSTYRHKKYYYPRRLLEQYGFTTQERPAGLSASMLAHKSFSSTLLALLNDLHTNGNDVSGPLDELEAMREAIITMNEVLEDIYMSALKAVNRSASTSLDD